MSARYSFRLTSELKNHPLPANVLLSQRPLEPLDHVLLKLLAYVLFQRERLQLEPRLSDENIPYIPDLVQLDYQMRPALWIECGETDARKLDRLAVKAPWAEIWVILPDSAALDALLGEMTRHNLRRGRYQLLAMDPDLFREMLQLLSDRNDLTLYHLDLLNGRFQLDFNGLWFESEMLRTTF